MSPDTSTEDPLRPDLTTRRLQLRLLRTEDLPLLYRLSLAPEVTFQWRYRGTTPSFEEFQRQVHAAILCQFVVSPIGSAEVFGHVMAYRPDFRHRFCYVGVLMRPALHRRGLGVEAFFGLARYLFYGWDFRILLLETDGHAIDTFRSAERAGLVTEEGRIRDQFFYGGRTWDGITLAHRREQFEAMARSHLGRSLLGGQRVLRTR